MDLNEYLLETRNLKSKM